MMKAEIKNPVRGWLLLALLLSSFILHPSSLPATPVVYHATNFTLLPLTNWVTLEPTPATNSITLFGGAFISGPPVVLKPDTNGYATTNLAPNLYTMKIAGSSQVIKVLITNTTATLDLYSNVFTGAGTFTGTNSWSGRVSVLGSDEAGYLSNKLTAGTNIVLVTKTNSGTVVVEINSSGGSSSTTNFGQLVISNAPTLNSNAARLLEVTNGDSAVITIAAAAAGTLVTNASTSLIAMYSLAVTNASGAVITMYSTAVTNASAYLLTAIGTSNAAVTNLLLNYLPLTGGTITGEVTNTANVSITNGALQLIGLGDALIAIKDQTSPHVQHYLYGESNGFQIFGANASRALVVRDGEVFARGAVMLNGWKASNFVFYGINDFGISTNRGGTWTNLDALTVALTNINQPVVFLAQSSHGTNALWQGRRGPAGSETNIITIASDGAIIQPLGTVAISNVLNGTLNVSNTVYIGNPATSSKIKLMPVAGGVLIARTDDQTQGAAIGGNSIAGIGLGVDAVLAWDGGSVADLFGVHSQQFGYGFLTNAIAITNRSPYATGTNSFAVDQAFTNGISRVQGVLTIVANPAVAGFAYVTVTVTNGARTNIYPFGIGAQGGLVTNFLRFDLNPKATWMITTNNVGAGTMSLTGLDIFGQ